MFLNLGQIVADSRLLALSSLHKCAEAAFERVKMGIELLDEALVVLLIQKVHEHLQDDDVCVVASLIERQFGLRGSQL